MKHIIIILFIISFQWAIGQKKIEYFPQEQVLIKGIENNTEASQFLYDYLENKALTFLEQPKVTKALIKFKKDTLKVKGVLIFDKKMKVDTEKSSFSLGNKQLNKNFKQKFESSLFNIPISNIIYKKSYPSKHFFQFNYKVIKTSDKLKLILTNNKKPYSGGVIEEVPRFPGCEGLDEKNARSCFQLQMQQHIKDNFKYPKEAYLQKISGRVSAIFTISKTGEITNIRTRGPHKILENDVIRIIKLLPNMTPGKQNGEPVKVPFSIPITYKLK